VFIDVDRTAVAIAVPVILVFFLALLVGGSLIYYYLYYRKQKKYQQVKVSGCGQVSGGVTIGLSEFGARWSACDGEMLVRVLPLDIILLTFTHVKLSC